MARAIAKQQTGGNGGRKQHGEIGESYKSGKKKEK